MSVPRHTRPSRRRRLLSGILPTLVAVATLTACSSGSTTADSTTPPPAVSDSTVSSSSASEPAGSAGSTGPSQDSSSPGTSSQPSTGGGSTAPGLDELYAKAKSEGTVTVYGGGSIIPKVKTDFEAAYPGVTIQDVDATDDALVARATSESRGGKVIGDVWQTPLDALQQMHDLGLLQDPLTVPEAAALADNLKGTYWVASDVQFLVGSWNTDQVSAADAPKSFEDFADPKWKGKLIAEPRDYQLFEALAKYKFKSDAAAEDYLNKLAANDVRFQSGHNTLDQMIAAGQAEVCITCYSNHYPPLQKDGAPVSFFLTEGIGQPNGTAILKGAPHPNAALLFTRWVVSQAGQQSYAKNGRIPALASVPPTDDTRPQIDYALSPEDLSNSKSYSDTWNRIFGLR